MTAALSVVLVTDTWETIAKTVRHLRAQTIANRIELVVAAPESAPLEPEPAEIEGFANVEVVRVPDISSLAWGREPAVRAAAAPIVAIGETHCFPEPEYAERLLEAHAGPWAAVGPAMLNANPSGLISRVNLLLDYGPWLAPTEGGELDDLPGHNSSYKQTVLLEFGPGLGAMLESGTIMHRELRGRGQRLYLEPRARTAHLNVTSPSAWLSERFQGGRRFASARSADWSFVRRVLYALGSPLIPVVRLVRLRRDLRRTGRTLGATGVVLLVVALAVSALGELVGYAVGSGNSMFLLSRIELHRERYLREAERVQVG